MTCPSCRSDVPAGARFCPECGQNLRQRGDERRVVTVLFADLVGFTSLSETRDPEQVKNLVDSCFERLVAHIDAFGGRVDKIVGDAILALFGAPTAHEDDAERAVRAALRMQQDMAAIASELAVPIQMRIGVNTGEVLVGALRAGGDYTAMGDVVNTASRLQTAAAPGTVLVGPATHAATSRVVAYEELPPVELRGREETVPVWRAIEALAPPGYRAERARATLIGRDAEMGLLRHTVENSIRNSRAALLLVMGEAGVGKSRLAEELGQQVACDHDAVVLEGRCVPYGEANVWGPIADALRHGAGIRTEDPTERVVELARQGVVQALGERATDEEVDEVLQGLLYLLGHDSALNDIDSERALDQATAAVTTFAERFATTRPVVVVLSDLHWADDMVLQLIDRMLEGLAASRFVVLATARPVIEERWHPPHGRHNLVALTLDPLTTEASAQLLCELAGVELAPSIADLLLSRSGGNPFFMEEMVSLLTTDGPGADGQEPGRLADLPDTLRGLIAARLDALAVTERSVLEACTVLGRRGPVMAIEVMAGKSLGLHEVGPVLEALQAKDLLVLSGRGSSAKWSFRSDMVREVAYNMLTKAERARSHHGIAAWMEAHEDTDRDSVIDQITNHYVRSAELVLDLGSVPGVPDDLVERALAWVERAAARATHRSYHVVASRLYSDGLSLLADAPSPRRRSFLAGRARALAGLREMAGARADIEASIAEARQAGADGTRQLAESLLVLADIEQKEERWAEAEAALREATDVYRQLDDARGETEALRLRGFGALLQHHYDLASELLEEALERFEALGDRRGAAWSQQNLAWCAFYAGRPAEAEAKLRKVADTFRELGDPGGLAWARGLLAWTRYQQGYAEEAGQLAEHVISHDLRGGDRWARGMMLLLAGSVRLWAGETMLAVERLTEARTIFEEIDDTFGLVQSSSVLGRALVLAGQVEEGLSISVAPGLRDEPQSWAHTMGRLMNLAASVQIGDAPRSNQLLAGPAVDIPRRLDALAEAGSTPTQGRDAMIMITEVVTMLGLHRLQTGDLAGALKLLEWLDALTDPVDPNLHSAVALVHAAAGDLDAAIREAAEVEACPGATYLDRTTAGIARASALTQRGDTAAAIAAFDQVMAGVDATQDRVSQALARLAYAVAAPALGGTDAEALMEDAEGRLAELGLRDTAWRQAFSLGMGLSPAA